MDVQVVGTSFNIRDAAETDTVEVAVLTGRVWVDPAHKAEGDKIELEPYHKLTISKKEGTVQKGTFTAAGTYIAGTGYDMSFMNTPLEVICKRIEEKFDVEVETGAGGRDCRVTGDFTDQSLSRTVEMLCKTVGASCTMQRDTVRIAGLNCK
jgi:ferric-dicitrate binding protein FerR (iron transport regulator)